MSEQTNQPETIMIDEQPVRLEELLADYQRLKADAATEKAIQKKATRKFNQEEELKPYQAELIRMQQYLEQKRKRMIILFEGRDAAGKGAPSVGSPAT